MPDSARNRQTSEDRSNFSVGQSHNPCVGLNFAFLRSYHAVSSCNVQAEFRRTVAICRGNFVMPKQMALAYEAEQVEEKGLGN